MKKYANETIIISKEAWKFMSNFSRENGGFRPLPEERLEWIWKRIYIRNGGANPETHPIGEDEIRINRDTFNMSWEDVRQILNDSGFEYRQDGFIITGIYV